MKALASRAWIALGAALVLGALNVAIVAKERIKRHGEIVYLALAPVDPRSLMQGDYMALRFALAGAIAQHDESAVDERQEGRVDVATITLDAQRVATLAPRGASTPLKIRYRIRDGGIWLGTNAFFFEEGSADRFSAARYGEFRIDADSGEAVLVGLRDAQLQPL